MKKPVTLWSALITSMLLVNPEPARSQIYEELYSFTAFGESGDEPRGTLIQASDGNFYGTTFYGGTYDFGTVFRITPREGLVTMASLNGTNNDQHPITGLVEATNGNFYCATVAPSSIDVMTPAGALTLWGDTLGTVNDGLLRADDGYIYVADFGDYQYNDGGFLFRFRPEGAGTVLFQFDYSAHPQDGLHPDGGMIQATDGNFYGTTREGGAYGFGVVYRLSINGTYTVMCSFSRGPNYTNSIWPYGRLLQASDGNFYGVSDGGNEASGAIFRMTPDGILSTFASLNGYFGEKPTGGLIEANDGCFYGTATSAGIMTNNGTVFANNGTVFKISPDGTVSLVLAFTGSSGPYPGASPYAALIQGNDGNLYGTCGTQGTRGAGNVFRLIMPGPQLWITNMAGEAVFSWRTNYVGFTLQSSEDVGTGNWLDCTNPPVAAGGQYFVTNNLSPGPHFFRLKK